MYVTEILEDLSASVYKKHLTPELTDNPLRQYCVYKRDYLVPREWDTNKAFELEKKYVVVFVYYIDYTVRIMLRSLTNGILFWKHFCCPL